MGMDQNTHAGYGQGYLVLKEASDRDTRNRMTGVTPEMRGGIPKMGGYIPDEPTPEPEPQNPAEKALDDFNARCVEKRKHVEGTPREEYDRWAATQKSEQAKSESLGNAMSKLAPHHHTIDARLAAYRGPVL